MTNLSLRRRLSDWLTGSRASRLHFQALENPPDDDCEAIRRGLLPYEARFAGTLSPQPVGAFVRDATGRIRGGATGYLERNWLTTERLWVEEALRRRGIGSRLMAQLERVALGKGVYRFRLATTSPEALAFFVANGYEIYATLPDHPPGLTDHQLRKIIDLTGGP